MSQRDTLVHLFAGGCGGTVGAILTCPLEVVKTRLQSSHITLYVSEVQLSTVNVPSVARMSPPGPLHCLKPQKVQSSAQNKPSTQTFQEAFARGTPYGKEP
ncbi:unnamed protein product [Oncorhynchus mykiss]|uniref:Uncharacterized protein n=1 Tax=Oncorhynchus mykiss TaxID=8022 RepID=A0A060Y2A4_ONCMY|nr:unnamed protein product [Oncorhynchus mykiss]